MAENIIATWRVPGLQKADPQKVYEELRTICDEVTEAKPQDIVNLAKDKKLEIHKCFEWNDTKAAEKWSLMSPKRGAPITVQLNHFTGWSADIPIKYTENVYSINEIATIINYAGFSIGIGSGRTSGYGRYHIVGIT